MRKFERSDTPEMQNLVTKPTHMRTFCDLSPLAGESDQHRAVRQRKSAVETLILGRFDPKVLIKLGVAVRKRERKVGRIKKDGPGLSANDQAILAPKKRRACGSGTLAAHAPEEMSVENRDSALIASCPRQTPLDGWDRVRDAESTTIGS